MSRVAKQPLPLPSGVSLEQQGQEVTVNGVKGSIRMRIPASVQIVQDGAVVQVSMREAGQNSTMAGTVRALLGNHVKGVSQGFERALELVGVGYRAQVQGNALNLALGYSHPILYPIPDGIRIETPSQTEIVVKGHDRQQVGQVAANIRAFRPPEPYKGKGVKYKGERILRKEAKKK
jgi:large subunit ribosomal protein L6